MYIVEKFRPNAKNTENRGRFRKCEKNFLAAREKNFPSEFVGQIANQSYVLFEDTTRR
jgi:hypothetical protein